MVSLGKGAMLRGLVIEQWDLALLLRGCHHSSVGGTHPISLTQFAEEEGHLPVDLQDREIL